MNYELVIYTMEGCSHCVEFKKLLEQENITYHDRDIDKYNKEYDMYSKITNTEFVPSVMLITGANTPNEKTHFFAPTKEYETIFEALDLVKKAII